MPQRNLYFHINQISFILFCFLSTMKGMQWLKGTSAGQRFGKRGCLVSVTNPQHWLSISWYPDSLEQKHEVINFTNVDFK